MKTPKTLKQLAVAVSKIAGKGKYTSADEVYHTFSSGNKERSFSVYAEGLGTYKGYTPEEAFTLFKAAHRKSNV